MNGWCIHIRLVHELPPKWSYVQSRCRGIIDASFFAFALSMRSFVHEKLTK
jgi:hypothetical protein